MHKGRRGTPRGRSPQRAPRALPAPNRCLFRSRPYLARGTAHTGLGALRGEGFPLPGLGTDHRPAGESPGPGRAPSAPRSLRAPRPSAVQGPRRPSPRPGRLSLALSLPPSLPASVTHHGAGCPRPQPLRGALGRRRCRSPAPPRCIWGAGAARRRRGPAGGASPRAQSGRRRGGGGGQGRCDGGAGPGRAEPSGSEGSAVAPAGDRRGMRAGHGLPATPAPPVPPRLAAPTGLGFEKCQSAQSGASLCGFRASGNPCHGVPGAVVTDVFSTPVSFHIPFCVKTYAAIFVFFEFSLPRLVFTCC